MKLLFDANISHKLVERLSDLFPGSVHIRECGLSTNDDRVVWRYVLDGGFTIVSKDEDFHQMAFVHGPPPKVVWIRLGNCRTDEIERAIRQGSDHIHELADDAEASFLVLGSV